MLRAALVLAIALTLFTAPASHGQEQQHDAAPVGPDRRRIAGEYPYGERIEQRDHRDHRDGGECEAKVTIEISGDRQRDEGLPARCALKQ